MIWEPCLRGGAREEQYAPPIGHHAAGGAHHGERRLHIEPQRLGQLRLGGEVSRLEEDRPDGIDDAGDPPMASLRIGDERLDGGEVGGLDRMGLSAE